MSYEGYTEYRCACGKTDTADVYSVQPTECRCGKPFVKVREVDLTNSEPEYGRWEWLKPPVESDTPWGKIPPCRAHALEHPEEDAFMVASEQAAEVANISNVAVLERPVKSSDGGATDYYRLPAGAAELNDLIEHKGMSFALGNIFKACYRFGEKDTASRLYDLNKIIYFAERLKALEQRQQAA